MQDESRTTLKISDREGTVKRALVKKAIAEAYAETGIAPLWKGKVSKHIIKLNKK